MTVSFDRVADVYDATRALPPDAAGAVTAGIARALRGVASAPRLLELGIGTGRIAVPLAEAGVRVVGVDVAPAMLARLRAKRTDLPVVLGDATAPPFRAGTFDGALFVHVLHLVTDARALLRAVRALVRPGGALLLGLTEHAEHARAAYEVVRGVLAELGGSSPRYGDWNVLARAAFVGAAAEAGAACRDETLARWTERTSGRRVLDALAGRVYSSSWAIPDALMPELLARLAPRLEALAGDLDAPLESEASFVLLEARLPG